MDDHRENLAPRKAILSLMEYATPDTQPSTLEPTDCNRQRCGFPL